MEFASMFFREKWSDSDVSARDHVYAVPDTDTLTALDCCVQWPEKWPLGILIRLLHKAQAFLSGACVMRLQFSQRGLIRTSIGHRSIVLAIIAFSVMQSGSSASAEEKATKPSQDNSDEASPKSKADADKGAPDKSSVADRDGWKPLFNGKDLEGWKVTNFGGEGEVFVEDGEVVISQGADLSGIHTEQEIPKSNYEIQYEAQRVAGSDFFAGLTFPVKDSHCSLIIGGWGGGVCGISSLNGMDASENETTSYQAFEKGKWYKIKVIVRDNHLHAWIDDAKIVDVDTTGMRIGTRFEVDRSKPFGFATYATTGRLKNVRVRTLPPEDAK